MRPASKAPSNVFTPPLRESGTRKNWWNGLKRDHLQVVSEPITVPSASKEQKELGRDDFTKIPNGGPGVEHRMSLIYSAAFAQGRFTVNVLWNWFPRLPPNSLACIHARSIAVGSDADLVIFDPDRKHNDQREDAPHARSTIDV